MSAHQSTPRILKIGDVSLGGGPTGTPTALVGSIFYYGDRLVHDHSSGEFDKAAAVREIQAVSDVAELTRLPTMLDVVATTPTAIASYIRFLADVVEWPLLIDGSASSEVNIAGIVAAEEAGLLGRVVLNSLSPDTSDELYTKIQEHGLKSAVLLTFTESSIVSVSGRVKHARDLLAKATHAGISNVLFDTGVVDPPTLAIACRAQQIIKDQHGFPVGCGAHNAYSTWSGFKARFGHEARMAAYVSAVAMSVVEGADFVLYGPIKYAPIIYPGVYMVDTAISGLALDRGT